MAIYAFLISLELTTWLMHAQVAAMIDDGPKGGIPSLSFIVLAPGYLISIAIASALIAWIRTKHLTLPGLNAYLAIGILCVCGLTFAICLRFA